LTSLTLFQSRCCGVTSQIPRAFYSLKVLPLAQLRGISLPSFLLDRRPSKIGPTRQPPLRAVTEKGPPPLFPRFLRLAPRPRLLPPVDATPQGLRRLLVFLVLPPRSSRTPHAPPPPVVLVFMPHAVLLTSLSVFRLYFPGLVKSPPRQPLFCAFYALLRLAMSPARPSPPPFLPAPAKPPQLRSFLSLNRLAPSLFRIDQPSLNSLVPLMKVLLNSHPRQSFVAGTHWLFQLIYLFGTFLIGQRQALCPLCWDFGCS